MKSKGVINLKSLISLTVSFLMVAALVSASLFVSHAASVETVFTDVSQDDWFCGDVQYAYDNGIMNGVAEDKFDPNSPLSRAMGVTILYRAAGEPAVGDSVKVPFNDVEIGQWYSDAVMWAYNSGIVNGRAADEFATNDYITRAELAAMLLRYADGAGLELPETKSGNFADKEKIPDYAKEAVDKLYKAEIINGKEDNRFDPSASVTRADTAAMIRRFAEKAKKTSNEEPLTVLFIGNSYTITGHTGFHIRSIANNEIKVRDLSDFGFSLNKHVQVFQKNPNAAYITRPFKEADIVVFQEFAGAFPDTEAVETLMDMIGRDKKYYAFMPFTGPSDDGFNKNYQRDIRIYTNEELREEKEKYADMGITLVYLGNVTPYNSELNESDFFEIDGHPKELMGYCIALALYCTFFDEKAADQNNGELSSNVIPGETAESEAEYMAKLKETVQHILDIQ